MKKLLCLAAVLLCALGCAWAEVELEVFTSGDSMYIVLEDGMAEIVDYSGEEEELPVPEMLDGRTVTAIGDEAFYECKSLTSITSPDSVTTIEDRAFIGCAALASVSLRASGPRPSATVFP